MELKVIGKAVLSISAEECANLRETKKFLFNLCKKMQNGDFKFVASDYDTLSDEQFEDVIHILDVLTDDDITEDGLELI